MLCWMYLKDSLPHLVNLFAIYTGISYSFEFHSLNVFFSLAPSIYPNASAFVFFLFSFFSSKVFVNDNKSAHCSRKKRIANWFRFIKVQKEWMVGNNEPFFLSLQKELSQFILNGWRRETASAMMTPTLKKKKIESTIQWNGKCTRALCIQFIVAGFR